MAQIVNKTAICTRVTALLILLAGALAAGQAQSLPQPDREQLLNGLTILYANRAGDPNVLLRLRLHSGAVFDLAGKAGLMALLADAMFPESTTREYITEQLGGRLDVNTSYDTIDVTITGKASELERMIELLRNAVINLNLSPENVATLREARIKELSETQSSISDAANRAVAARLFGTFPYANPAKGTVDSVTKIERADLMLARDRFLNADNATLVVVGGVDKARLMRTVRQLLGPWQKSERIVPATFRQPGAVENRVFLIDQSGARTAEIRLAVRAPARSDPDAMTASLLAAITKQRWQATQSDLSSVVVVYEPHALNGMFMLGATVPVSSAAKAIASAQATIHAIAKQAPTAVEVENARRLTATKPVSQLDSIAEAWLDAETYKLAASNSSTDSVSPDDIRRVAARLFADPSTEAIVALGNAAELKLQFGDKAELRVEVPSAKPANNAPSPPKKP